MTSAKISGAFFDLDGTLLAPPSLERRFIFYLFEHHELGPTQAAQWLAQFARAIGGGDWRRAMEGNKAYLAGLAESLAEDWAAWTESAALPSLDEGAHRLIWHAGQSHRIFIVSGSLAPLVRSVVRWLPAQAEVCATELESSGGHWTGRMRGEHVSFSAKASAVRRLAARRGVNLADSFAYGNSFSDLAMLEATGHPTAVNPSARLQRVAAQRGWPVVCWHATEGEKMTARPPLVAASCSEVQR
jgi:putative phosphoserine phosphatase/1-acylglycerol-3-phosphate O-acyltransferase